MTVAQMRQQAAVAPEPAGRRVVLNLDACIECFSCAAACHYGHGRMPTVPDARTGAVTLPVICRQCKEPACLKACASGAARRDASGVVHRAASECRGCGSCALACPFGLIPQLPVGTHIRRCDLCLDRTARDEPPRCVAACPSGALAFWRQDDQAEEAGFVLLGSRTIGLHPVRRR